MSLQAARGGPCLRALAIGSWLLVGVTPVSLLAQPSKSESPASPQVVQEQSPYAGFVAEPRVLRKGINWAVDVFGDGSARPPKDGFYVDTGNMVTGAGWISGGPGYRQQLFNRRALIETSAAVSWRFYKMAQGRFEFTDLADTHLAIGTQVMWRDMTQVQYFGLGPESLEDLRSQYRIKTTNVVGYARYRPKMWLTVTGDIGWLRRPTVLGTSGWFERDLPEVTTTFPADPAVSLPVQPNFLHGGVGVVADTRDYRGHPTRGGVYRAGWTTFRDQTSGVFTFDRYEAEAAHFVPLADRRWVFAFHGWTAISHVADDRDVPFYLMPSIGGANTIRSYSDYRFHDRNIAVVNVESRWALLAHVDVAAFFDAGNVARRAGDLNFDKTAFGVGVRLHTQRTTLARLDVARGSGGWELLFRTSDPFHLKRLSRRTAPAPFAP